MGASHRTENKGAEDSARKDVAESRPCDRPKLLPRLGVLGIISLFVGVIAHTPVAFLVMILLPTGYLGYVILKTRDLVSNSARLHPTDRWICRKSGFLATALAAALLMGVSVLMAQNIEPEAIGLESRWGMSLVGFVMEIGVVLCVACLGAPRDLRHVRPLILWKVMAIPLLLIYGAYVVLLLITPFATVMATQE